MDRTSSCVWMAHHKGTASGRQLITIELPHYPYMRILEFTNGEWCSLKQLSRHGLEEMRTTRDLRRSGLVAIYE